MYLDIKTEENQQKHAHTLAAAPLEARLDVPSYTADYWGKASLSKKIVFKMKINYNKTIFNKISNKINPFLTPQVYIYTNTLAHTASCTPIAC